MSNSAADSRRWQMVDAQLVKRGIQDPRVLDTMRSVPREFFLNPELGDQAYDDRALPNSLGQTVSQPYIVACMTEALRIVPTDRILEIGTGSGYQTAILASLAHHVVTIERLESLSMAAEARIQALHHNNVEFLVGDGTLGWSPGAPFDGIIVTAAAPRIIDCLVEQLGEGGRLVIPVGDEKRQHLTVVERSVDRIIECPSIPVRFVRLIGERGFPA